MNKLIPVVVYPDFIDQFTCPGCDTLITHSLVAPVTDYICPHCDTQFFVYYEEDFTPPQATLQLIPQWVNDQNFWRYCDAQGLAPLLRAQGPGFKLYSHTTPGRDGELSTPSTFFTQFHLVTERPVFRAPLYAYNDPNSHTIYFPVIVTNNHVDEIHPRIITQNAASSPLVPLSAPILNQIDTFVDALPHDIHNLALFDYWSRLYLAQRLEQVLSTALAIPVIVISEAQIEPQVNHGELRKSSHAHRITGEQSMSEFKRYQRISIAEMRPYVEGEVLSDRVSISAADKENGSPKAGDMIARNPKNHDDQWLVATDYFADNFASVEAQPQVPDLETDLALALEMLAKWAAAIRDGGGGWDYWDWHYKNVMHGKHRLRERLDVLLASQEQERGE